MKDSPICSPDSGSTVVESKSRTVFEKAFQVYVATLPEKKNTRKLILDSFAESGSPPKTPEEIQATIEEIEKESAGKLSRRASKLVLKPVVEAVTAYAGVIDTMCQVDPFPLSIIWGAFKIFINCGNRFTNLFETIQQQLLDLRNHLERISFYDELYKHKSLQELLCKSYVNVLRFWARVRKECERPAFNTFLKAAAPFSTKKLNAIVLDLSRDATAIEELAERIEKGRSQAERDLSAQYHAQQEEDRKVRSYNELRQWLNIGNPSQCDIEEADYRRHEQNRNSQNCTPGTSQWIFNIEEFVKWTNPSAGSSPVLWLSGIPGAGKSVLCSRVIQHIRETEPSAAVAFHFFRFDHQQSSTIEILRVLAMQLVESLWNSTTELPDTILAITQKSPNNYKNVLEMINAVTSSSVMSKVFIFIDGLDEEVTGRPMDVSLETLNNLISVASSVENQGKIRLWLSSQPNIQITKVMVSFPRIHFAKQNEDDIMLMFEKRLPELGDIDVSEEEKNHWLSTLKDQAKGNFLWARCMIDNLVEKAESVADIKALINHTVPPDINEYYRRQFRRISPDSRDLASKIFSIVCYCRRPVSVSELCDAIGLLKMAEPSYQGGDPKPFPRAVKKLLSPMIIEEEFRDGSEKRCRIFHSTVKEFLKRNPLVEGISITPSVLANVCLLYLCQPRYGGLLKKIGCEWRTADGQSIEKDYFLQYTAKYWYLHLNHITPSTELTDKILAFLHSPNFQTLLQLQYLYVEGQFSVFTMRDKPESVKFLKRAFPVWFTGQTAQMPRNSHLSQDYRQFLHEWSHLLQCGCCENLFCARSCCAGEIDRCFFGALGENNFMARMQSRYLSFQFSTGGVDGVQSARQQCYEGYSACGEILYLIYFASRTDSSLRFICETWHLKNKTKPILYKRQIIDVDEKQANWSLYFENDDTNIYVRLGRAKPISFDYDARALRIGSQIYLRDAEGAFQRGFIGNLAEKDRPPPYFEEFVTRPGFVLVASRRKAPVINKLTNDALSIDMAFQDVAMLFSNEKQHNDHDSSTESDGFESNGSESQSESIGSSTSETGVDWTSGAETWSEASTELEDVLEDENALVVFRGYVESSESGSESSSADGDVSEEESSGEEESSSDVDENGLEFTPYSRFMRGFLDDDSDGDDAYVALGPSAYGSESEDSDSGAFRVFRSQYGSAFRRKRATSSLEASITVFATAPEAGLKCIFRLSKELSLVLYESPPILHPFKPLLVWPMSPGTVLFADFVQKTWFTRKLRPTTSHTRQVFVKCHFSACGKYLHIATLEARRKPSQRKERVAEQEETKSKSNESRSRHVEPLELSLFVNTYRLSVHKTTRAPPVQIYRTKTALGSVLSLPVSRLPFSLTWMPQELYLSYSSTVLSTVRIKLFKPSPGEEAVLVPRDSIYLPTSARAREIRLFYSTTPSPNIDSESSSDDARNVGWVIMGSERKATNSSADNESSPHSDYGDVYGNGIVDGWVSQPEAIKGLPVTSSLPLGFYFSDANIGGWVRSEDALDMPEDRGIGRLDNKVERFDVDEDCDLEPYIV